MLKKKKGTVNEMVNPEPFISFDEEWKSWENIVGQKVWAKGGKLGGT